MEVVKNINIVVANNLVIWNRKKLKHKSLLIKNFDFIIKILKGMIYMEKFYFESPSLERKNEIIEYLDEFVEYGSNINGSGSLDKIYDGYTFEEVLERCLNMENEEYSKKFERCPAKTFLLIRESDNKIVGTINIRWNLNEKMLQFGGHIGYGIKLIYI